MTLSTSQLPRAQGEDSLSAGVIWLSSAAFGTTVPIYTSKDLGLWLPLRFQFPS